MGAQQSVYISCIVDRLTQEQGESVKGSVKIQVNAAELSKFDGITVTLAGVECTRIPETGEIVPGNRKITITQDIVQFKDGKIAQGEYEFPFSLSLPYETITKEQQQQGASSAIKIVESNTDSALPALIDSKSDSSIESSSSSADDVSTVSLPTQAAPSAVAITTTNNNKQIMYQIKANLKRKPGVPITVDTDFRCKARSAGDILVQ